MGLLKTIFIVVIIYYLIRFVGRVILPLFIAGKLKEMQDRHFGQKNQSNTKRRKEGEVTIQKQSANKKMTSANMGEYVDFEEVKEP
jgi:hypothetical protein